MFDAAGFLAIDGYENETTREIMARESRSLTFTKIYKAGELL